MSDDRPDLTDLWDFDDPVMTEERFRALLEDDLGPAHRVEVLTQVARTDGLQRRFGDADSMLDEAALLEVDDRGRGRDRARAGTRPPLCR